MPGDYKTFRLASEAELNIAKTLDCGQCFRWNRTESGAWFGVAGEYDALAEAEGGEVYITSRAPEDFWRGYFDMSLDYAAISRGHGAGDYMADCVSFGAGIRILNQDPWETLCSFIISQCNNITRIKGIVERLCALCGEKRQGMAGEYHLFPAPSALAPLEPEALAPIRAGYRAPYLIHAAREFCEGRLDFSALKAMDFDSAKKQLKTLPGVGDKVADCAVLFGLHKLEAFPVDVWIRRALNQHFPPDFDPKSLGEYAGLFQQYIYYYARWHGDD